MHRTMSHALATLVLAGGLSLSNSLFLLGCSNSAPVAPESTTQSIDPALAYEFQSAPSDGVTYSGVLTDSTGIAVDGADVLVAGELATITGDDGSYTVTVAAGTDTLEFGIADFVFHSVHLDPETRTVQGQPGDPGDPSRGLLGGTVSDQFGPVGDALVVFANAQGFFKWTRTGPAGIYELGLVPAGPGMLGATAHGHDVEIQRIVVRQDAVNRHPITLAKFPPHGHLVGVVMDDDSTREELIPVAGARVTLYRRGHPDRRVTVRTNHNGAYFFGLIPAGDYVMVVRKEGYCPKMRGVSVERGRNFQNVKLADVDPASPCEGGLPGDFPGDGDRGGGFGD